MEIVRKDLTNFTAEAWLIKLAENEIVRVDGEIVNSKYFAVSGRNAYPIGDTETMIFQCDENGKVRNWMRVVSIRAIAHQEAIDALNIEIQES